MNVKEAFERLKQARAYCGKNIYPHWPGLRFGHGAGSNALNPSVKERTAELDKSFRDAVDTLEACIVAPPYSQYLELQKRYDAQCEAYETLRRTRQVSENFRNDPNARQWNTSYTKRIVDLLTEFFPHSASGEWVKTPRYAAIKSAIDLLTDYHTTLHVPYAERDAWRKEAEAQRDKYTKLLADFAMAKAERDRVSAECDRMKAGYIAPSSRVLKDAVALEDISYFVDYAKRGDAVEVPLVARVFDALSFERKKHTETLKILEQERITHDAGSKYSRELKHDISAVRTRLLILKGNLIRRLGREPVQALIISAKKSAPTGVCTALDDSSITNTSIKQLGIVEHALRVELEKNQTQAPAPAKPFILKDVRLSYNSLRPGAPGISSKLVDNLRHDLKAIMNESDDEHPRAAARTIVELINAKIAESKT